MSVFIGIIVIAFLYWSLVPASPKEPTLNDMINDSQKKQGLYSNVYQSALHTRTTGMNVYYSAKSPESPDDKKIFSGTKNECELYVSKSMNREI